MKAWKLPAREEELDRLAAAVAAELSASGVGPAEINAINLAAEEIFVNIAKYAYHNEPGEAYVECGISVGPDGEKNVILTFEDEGIPYNPLEHQEPDISMGFEERIPGGLGIFMVRQLMDDVRYSFAAGKNRLQMVKRVCMDE